MVPTCSFQNIRGNELFSRFEERHVFFSLVHRDLFLSLFEYPELLGVDLFSTLRCLQSYSLPKLRQLGGRQIFTVFFAQSFHRV